MSAESLFDKQIATEDMWDDQGYCDNRIKNGSAYYYRMVGYNSEKVCCECAMDFILHEHPELDFKVAQNKPVRG